MITGFNTDIEHDGVVYHVQTEDKGLDSPLILSLVYAGGAILASKRSPYHDLITAGFDEEELTQRLKRQHRLICAAINAGRIEDLKKMGVREPAAVEAASVPPEEIELVDNAADYAAVIETTTQGDTPESGEVVTNANDYAEFAESAQPTPMQEPVEEEEAALSEATPPGSPYTVYDSRRQSPLSEGPQPESGLVLTLLDEEEFRSGQTVQIRILVEDRSKAKEKPLSGVALSVKILGTTFRPQLYSMKTEKDGVAVVAAKIPAFTSGRAAILIRAVSGERSTETRRVIHAI